MKFIHQEYEWPNFKWDILVLLDPLVKATHKHGILMGQLSGLAPNIKSKAELESMTNEILATASFEGWDLKRGAVRSALAKKLAINIGETIEPDPLSQGYANLLWDAVKNASQPLSAERLFEWNGYIHPPGNSGVKGVITGAWRSAVTGVRQVLSGHLRHEILAYEPPVASCLPDNMRAFIEWYNLSCQDIQAKQAVPPKYAIHPVLEAGIAYLWLVAIHPFDRHNGLLGQALADSVLSRYTDQHGHFYSMSAQIQKDRKYYYQILEQSLKNGLEITPWLLLFIETLDKAVDEALAVFSGITRKVLIWEMASAFPLNKRQKHILHYLLDFSRSDVTTSFYAKYTKCSPDTALRDIRDLIGYKMLKRSPARGRNTKYELVLGQTFACAPDPAPTQASSCTQGSTQGHMPQQTSG